MYAPHEHGQPLFYRVLFVACSGSLTLADMKGNVSATREIARPAAGYVGAATIPSTKRKNKSAGSAPSATPKQGRPTRALVKVRAAQPTARARNRARVVTRPASQPEGIWKSV